MWRGVNDRADVSTMGGALGARGGAQHPAGSSASCSGTWDTMRNVSRAAPTLFVMVGLPASGKTTRAKQIEEDRQALRLTPDEWMIPLFDDNDANGKRSVLEGRFIWLALRALRLDIDVVLDFGVWSKDERTALRALAASAGASCELVYLGTDEANQRRWRDLRSFEEPETNFHITDEDLDEYRKRFERPDDAELSGAEPDPPPAGHTSWSSWAAEWWPTSIP
jgi:predicted kinase